MALTYYRHAQTGATVSGDVNDPTFRETLLTRRTDRDGRFAYEQATDAFPGALSAVELSAREALVAKINATLTPSPPVTVYDYQGDGTPLSDRATTLLEAYASAIAPCMSGPVVASDGEFITPAVYGPNSPNAFC